MASRSVVVAVPETVLLSEKTDEVSFARELQVLAAVKLYELGRLSSGPSEWLTLDLGAGELAAMALALENPQRILLLDDALARRTARAAGLTTWGTLRVLLEARKARLVPSVAPLEDLLAASGMWMSPDIRRRVLSLAGEDVAG